MDDKVAAPRPGRDTETSHKWPEESLATLARISTGKAEVRDECRPGHIDVHEGAGERIAEATPNVQDQWNILPVCIHYALNR